MMGRTVRNILQKSGHEAAANLVKKNFLDKIASFEGKHWFAMPIASEAWKRPEMLLPVMR